jgi:hypothetical protein
MGLARATGAGVWNLRLDFEAVLRAMQRAGDRQNVLAAHGVVVSDERLPIEVLDLQKTSSVEGQVLVHGEDEQSGRRPADDRCDAFDDTQRGEILARKYSAPELLRDQWSLSFEHEKG